LLDSALEDSSMRLREIVGLTSFRRPLRAEVVLSGLGGALLGAGLALLFAPTGGREQRGAIGERLEEYWKLPLGATINGGLRPER
jgi:hypothetical protein